MNNVYANIKKAGKWKFTCMVAYHYIRAYRNPEHRNSSVIFFPEELNTSSFSLSICIPHPTSEFSAEILFLSNNLCQEDQIVLWPVPLYWLFQEQEMLNWKFLKCENFVICWRWETWSQLTWHHDLFKPF